jgi:hypothetical protein
MAMKRHIRWAACLAAAFLATACTVYRYQDLDAQALAKAKSVTITRLQTADESFAFSEGDPTTIKDGAVIGSLRTTYTITPEDIAELTPEKKMARVVLKDGTRFRVVGSETTDGEHIRCLAIKTVGIPLNEVVRAQVRTVNTAGSIFSTLAGVVLVAGALALDVALNTDDGVYEPEGSFTVDLIGSLIESIPDPPAGAHGLKSNTAILGMRDASDVAGEKEFWTAEWTPVEARPGEDGKVRIPLGNASGVPRGVDRARLAVVDHPAGVTVARDVLGAVRSYAIPVPPESANDKNGRDIKDLLAANDGLLWRTEGGDPGPGAKGLVRDEITLTFPRPKGARHARLIVNAANSTWRSEFAREVLARNAPSGTTGLPAATGSSATTGLAATGQKAQPGLRPQGFPASSGYKNWEFNTLRVRMKTVLGWETGQVIFAVGPLAADDLIYDLDLGDVGSDKVMLTISPPAGYWLIDRLALDFGQDAALELVEVAAEGVDGPDAAEVIAALSDEDATTFLLNPADPPAQLTFTLPPPKEGMERSFFLRTVSCYEMPVEPKDKRTGSGEAGHASPGSE